MTDRIAIYHVDLVYGGPEEGGWYFEAGSLTDLTEVLLETEKNREKLQAICDERNEGRRPLSSVLSEGRYSVCNYVGDYYPKERSYYS